MCLYILCICNVNIYIYIYIYIYKFKMDYNNLLKSAQLSDLIKVYITD